ncbi:MAG: hypothetical protein ACI915_000904 [Gammaproteobacteria bacterium]|jgi:hypothetical protein
MLIADNLYVNRTPYLVIRKRTFSNRLTVLRMLPPDFGLLRTLARLAMHRVIIAILNWTDRLIIPYPAFEFSRKPFFALNVSFTHCSDVTDQGLRGTQGCRISITNRRFRESSLRVKS